LNGSRDSALHELCRRVKEYTNANEKVVYDTIAILRGAADLVANITDKGCVWSWS